LNDIQKPSYQSFPEFGLGPGDNPIFPGIYDAAASAAGTSLVATEYLFTSDDRMRAFNIMGGLHHALPDTASGFCILNDCAIAIQSMLDKFPGKRVMYLDIDCHHGDGVQWIFYKTSQVLTLSFHQSGRTLFPGTGFTNEIGEGDGKGYSLNVPLPPGTFDEIYQYAFQKIVPNVMDAYKPDIVVSQLGVDTHFADPLTDLALSTTGQEKIIKLINEYVDKYCTMNKLLALGGGGYDISVVGRTWSMALAEFAGISIADPLPDDWVEEVKAIDHDYHYLELLRDKNYRTEELQLKNPYYVTDMQDKVDVIVDEFEKFLIPNIKSK
jgi:acetoin utilization protein AcuC